MISDEAARKLEKELKAKARPRVGREQLARETPVKPPRLGQCYICGCKIHRTEKVCGECICEDDSNY